METPAPKVCPSEDVFVLMLQDELDARERAELEEHLDVCAICSQLVVELADLLSVHDEVIGASIESADVLPDVVSGGAGRVDFEGYELEGVLGAGGMGLVYRARDITLDREVAIKVIRADALGTDQAEQLGARLIREAKMLARVNHPNVVTIHEANVTSSRVYLVMELVEGRSFDRVLREQELDWREVVALYLQVCDGLNAAHHVGVIHRDIKPSNIIVTSDRRAVLTDFGLARGALEFTQQRGGTLTSLTRSGAILGTPAYMPPEQHLGGVADERSDMFSLCASLYASLYGERPFAGESIEEVALNACSGDMRQPSAPGDVPARMVEVLRRGMARRKEERFDRVDDLKQALEVVLEEGERSTSRGGRVMAALVCGVMCVGVIVWWGSSTISEEEVSDEVVVAMPPGEVEAIRFEAVSDGVKRAYGDAVVAMHREESVSSARVSIGDALSSSVKASHEHKKKGKPSRSTRALTATASPSLAPEEKGKFDFVTRVQSRVHKALFLRDARMCDRALEQLPADYEYGDIYRSTCAYLNGECERAEALVRAHYDKVAPEADVEGLLESSKSYCRPPTSEPEKRFAWEAEVFWSNDTVVCIAQAPDLLATLRQKGFRERLVQQDLSGSVRSSLEKGLKCIARSKKDVCELGHDMARMALELVHGDRLSAEVYEERLNKKLEDHGLARCVVP